MPAATSIEADLVTHNKSIGAPLHCNRLYGYGLRCGVSIADDPNSSPLFRANKSPLQNFKDQRLRGRCACKHRNIRREISCGCDALASVAAVFVLFCRKWRRAPTKALRHFIRGHRPRAGCLSANQGMPVQIRLIAPIFLETHNVCGGRQLAQQSLQNSAGSGQHRDAVPLSMGR